MKEEIKKWVTVNLGYKILALFIAFFLWFYVIGEKLAEKVYRLPVIFQNISRDLIVVPRTPRVSVILKAPRNLIMNHNPEDFFISKNLKNYTPGKYSISVSLKDVPLDEKEIEIVGIEPEVVDIEIKVLEERLVFFREVPIKILEPPASFFRANLETTEVYLELIKAEEYMSKLDIAEIMVFLDVSELKEGVYQLPVQVKVPPGVKLVKVKPEVVKVTLEPLEK